MGQLGPWTVTALGPVQGPLPSIATVLWLKNERPKRSPTEIFHSIDLCTSGQR